MNKPFETLPENIQKEVKSALKAYDEAYVIYEYGKYEVTVGLSIKAEYAPDHKFIGTYLAEEIFTAEERILNYVNVFQSYPFEYKGKRDYSIFHTGKREEFIMVNGNIEIKK